MKTKLTIIMHYQSEKTAGKVFQIPLRGAGMVNFAVGNFFIRWWEPEAGFPIMWERGGHGGGAPP